MGKSEHPGVVDRKAASQKEAFNAYLQEARSWETSEVLSLRKSVKLAWCIAGAGVLAGLLGLASATYQASKEAPMPVVLHWNELTGVVRRLDSLEEGKISVKEATDKYFAQLYVQYREQWSKEEAKLNYYRVGLMSTAEEQQRLDALFRSDQSPAKLYGDKTRVRIVLKGTSLLTPGVASVRYARIVERPNNAPEVSSHTATVTFAYSSGRMSEYDRSINPLGFQASYRSDPDTPGGPPQLAPTPAARPASPPPAAYPVSPAAGPPARLDLRTLQERGQ